MILPLINPRPSRRRRVASRKKTSFLEKYLAARKPRVRKFTKAKKGSFLSSYMKQRRKSSAKKVKVVKRPARRRGSSLKQKEYGMVYRISHRRRTRRASRRHNPGKGFSLYTKRSKAPRFGKHRPKVYYGTIPRGRNKDRTGWYRKRTSKLFPRPTLINPRRRRRARRNPEVGAVVTNGYRRRSRRYRRNPKFSLAKLNLKKTAISAAKIAGGLTAGFLMLPLLHKVATLAQPNNQPLLDNVDKFKGVLQLVIGGVAAALVKNKEIKDAAMIVAAVGIYDLISRNIPIGLPVIADPGKFFSFVNGEEEPGVIGMGSSYQQVGSDYAPALGSSYSEMSGDDISYGSDTLELD